VGLHHSSGDTLQGSSECVCALYGSLVKAFSVIDISFHMLIWCFYDVLEHKLRVKRVKCADTILEFQSQYILDC